MEAITDYPASILQRSDFDRLLEALRVRGYLTVGPRIVDGAIVLDEVHSITDFPIGRSAQIGAGMYRLTQRADKAVFGYVVGPTSAKKWLFPPKRTLWRAKIEEGKAAFQTSPQVPQKTALIGLRACDLQAIAVQDKVFLQGSHPDPYYKSMRQRLLLVVVDCAEPAPTCFCTSVGGNPAANRGYDVRITELLDEAGHRFILQPGSELGLEIVGALPTLAATSQELAHRESINQDAETAITKHLDTTGIKELLYDNAQHPRWTEVASRCLACGNCTMACPTCFCSSVDTKTDLGSSEIRQERSWDSCFNEDFSYIHGGVVRLSTMSRYRQWMTHKLASWTDQFGVMGCVGCGRCIAWCPVGIDITEEVAAIRSQGANTNA